MDIINITKDKDLEEKKQKAENHVCQDICNNYLDEEVHFLEENCSNLAHETDQYCYKTLLRKSMPHYKQCKLSSALDTKSINLLSRYKSKMRKSAPKIKYRRFSALGISALVIQSIDHKST